MLLLDRLSKAKTINKIIVAIPDTSENNKLEILLRKNMKSLEEVKKNVLKDILIAQKNTQSKIY